MGGPIRILAREKQCVGAGKCESRPLTEEEILKYGSIKPTKGKPVFHIPKTPTKKEVEKMGAKIIPPAKEKLLETLTGIRGKTKAVKNAAKIFGTSDPTIYKWMKDYGIDFDVDGLVIVKVEDPKQELAGDDITDDIKAIQMGTVIIPKKEPGTITIAGQETEEIHRKLAYAEHDIGSATVIYDFRADLVKIVTLDDNEMTPEVARAVAEDILDILGNE